MHPTLYSKQIQPHKIERLVSIAKALQSGKLAKEVMSDHDRTQHQFSEDLRLLVTHARTPHRAQDYKSVSLEQLTNNLNEFVRRQERIAEFIERERVMYEDEMTQLCPRSE